MIYATPYVDCGITMITVVVFDIWWSYSKQIRMSCLFFISPSSISDGTLECPPDSAVCMHIARSTLLHSFWWFDPRVGASFFVDCCMDEVCASVGSILGDIHHPPLNPLPCIRPSSNFSMQNPPTWTVSMMGPLLHSWPIQPLPLPYWYHVRKCCKWNGLIPPTTIILSHRRRLHLDHGFPLCNGLKARTVHGA